MIGVSPEALPAAALCGRRRLCQSAAAGYPRDRRADAPLMTFQYVNVDWRFDEGGSLVVICALCGGHSTLVRTPALKPRTDGGGHTVDSIGRVAPSIVCPLDGCTWHVWGRLAGWIDSEDRPKLSDVDA